MSVMVSIRKENAKCCVPVGLFVVTVGVLGHEGTDC